MHIMLFGGAFDPPHNGHLHVAQSIIDQHIADEIWFIPCAQHPFGKKMSPVSERVAMLRQADSLMINTYELEQTTISFTIETITHFATTMPEHSFSWLIGSDQLPSFTRWHRWEDLLKTYSVFVYPRQAFPFDGLQPGMIALKQLPLITISSTMVRQLVQEKKPFAQLVPPGVARYIIENNLYVKNSNE